MAKEERRGIKIKMEYQLIVMGNKKEKLRKLSGNKKDSMPEWRKTRDNK